MKRIIVIILYLLCHLFSYGQDNAILAAFNEDNKKVFFQGEVIALDLIITNNTSEDIAICWYSSGVLYSTTHNLGVAGLETIAPSDFERPKRGRNSYVIGSNDTVPLSPSRGCDFAQFYNHIVPFESDYHYTVLLNNGIGNHIYYPGTISYPLPLGQYDYTVTLSLSNGTVIIRKYEFEVVEPTPQQALYLDKFADVFDYDNMEAVYDFFLSCHDPDVKSKALTWIYRNINHLDSYSLNFWKNNVKTINNNVLLIQHLNQFVRENGKNDVFLNKLNTDRATVYNDLLVQLKDKDLEVSEAFINTIESKNMYKEDYEIYEPITQESLRRMRWLYIINKKRKERQD